MNKFTPGPWNVRFMGDDPEASDFFVQAPKTDTNMAYNIEVMGEDYGSHTGYPREQKVADAHLIAAAPELLEALELLVGPAETYGVRKSVTDLARKAIQKSRVPISAVFTDGTFTAPEDETYEVTHRKDIETKGG